MQMKTKISYSQTGVNYDVLDSLKRLSQLKGKQTSQNLLKFSAKEIEQSRGEAAYVWQEEGSYRAFVMEGLGTKNLVADEMAKITGQTYYDSIAQDTVAANVNDIITVGALPQVINAYFGTGGNDDWFSDEKKVEALVEGWTNACQLAGVTWGGGETPGLKGIINPQTVDLAGSCIGIIKPKERLTLGDKIVEGDSILFFESSGIHANGISLARAIADKLPEGYSTKLSDGKMYGETILIPTYIYVALVKDLFEQGVDIHYMVNITGHGWRKLMRADREFNYVIDQIPPISPIFDFIQKNSGNDESQMYATFNMGAGFAILLPKDQVKKVQEISSKNNLKSWDAGVVEKGPRQVIIKEKDIIFEGKSLGIR